MNRLPSSAALFLVLLAGCGLILSTAARPAAAAEEAASSWASFRGPEGAGGVVGGLPAGDGQLAFEPRWKRALGSGYSGISVAAGKAVTAMTEAGRDFVVALDAASGEELWRYDLAPAYAGHDGSHDGPIATPAIAAGRVFMLGPFGHLAAIDFETGKGLWTKHLVDDLGREVPYYGFAGSPAVVGETLVLQVGGDAAVAGFDVATGELRWQALADGGELGAQSPIVAEIGGAPQVLVLAETKMAGLDPADGALLWEIAFEGESGATGSYSQSPLPIGGDRILVKHQEGETSVVEITKGESGWRAAVVATSRGLAGSYSPPSLGRELLFGYSNRFLSAVDPKSGEVAWRSRHPGDGFLVHVDDQLVVLTKKGSLHLGAASADDWHESARLDLFDDLAWTPPSWAGGALFVRSLGEIARVDLVRRERDRVTAAEAPLPAVLAPLAAALATAEDSAAAVEGFLAGRPLPLVDGETVVFLWRGQAEDVAIGGDMIGMRREEPMRRLEGTDLWWWSVTLDRRARMSYLFFVDNEPALDLSHERRVTSTVLGPDMNWNRGQPVEMSWFAMPQWPGLQGEEAGTSAAAGRLETIELTVRPPTPEGGEAPEPVAVPIQVWLPPGYDGGEERYPVVYVHHREALEQGAWREALERSVGKTVAPLIAVFLEVPRMRGFGGLFVEQVVPEIDARYLTRADRASRANVGMGFPGFGAAMTTFGHPESFGRLGVQSMYMLEEQMAALRAALAELDPEATPIEIYLEWGKWDLISPHEAMDFRAASRLGWDLLVEQGWKPIGGEVWDSTDFASWRNRTGVLLEVLFPLAGTENGLAAWQTGD